MSEMTDDELACRPSRLTRARRHATGIVVAVAIIVGGSYGWTKITGAGAPADHSSDIASTIGATYCYMTSFEITNKIDGSKQPLYDCSMNSGGEKCVTSSNGIVNDETAVAKLLFSQTLGTSKPSCAT